MILNGEAYIYIEPDLSVIYRSFFHLSWLFMKLSAVIL